ncbi:unnamed protein product [Agarophyton chilense]
MEAGSVPQQKAHRISRSKGKKKKSKSPGTGGKKQAVAKPGALARRIRLAADRSEKRAFNPALPVDRTGGDAAPRVITVVGPQGVGKSTIIRNLVKHYSKRNIPSITGPITIVAGHRKRITFVEVGADLSSMIDAAKVADLVLLVIDASFGFEMETFEFLNIASTHGMPKIMAVLTHLDKLRDGKQVRNAKKSFKDRIWAELYDGAKVFYLSGITTGGEYLKREVLNLARFISVTKYPNIRWRSDHPYVLADRIEDISPKSLPEIANRTVAAYGYVRGTPLRTAAGTWRLHLAGVGDLSAQNVELLPDPCPAANLKTDQTPKESAARDGKSRRKISQKERMVYAPMAPEIDGIAFDRDAVYINLAPDDVRFSDKAALVTEDGTVFGADAQGEESSDGEGERMVKRLQKADATALDEKLKNATLQLVKGGKKFVSGQIENDRIRRPADFSAKGDNSAVLSENSGGSLIGKIKRKVRRRSESERDGESDGEGDGESDSESDDEGDSNSDSQSDGVSDREREREREGVSYAGDFEGQDKVVSYEEKNTPVDLREEESDGEQDDASISSSSTSGKSQTKEEIPDEEMYARRWKDLTLKNAEKSLKNAVSPSKALEKYIYGENQGGTETENGDMDSDEEPVGEREEEEFFRPRNQQKSDENGMMFSTAVLDDFTRLIPQVTRNWVSDELACAKLRRRRFGTGQRQVDSSETPREEERDEEDALDGSFEDLETGEKHVGQSSEAEDFGEGPDEQDYMESIKEKKIQKKQEFDKDWDTREARDSDSDAEMLVNSTQEVRPGAKSRKAVRDAAMRTPDPRKQERERFEKLRNQEFGELDTESRIALEGITPGQYVRMELQDVPVEFVKFFDPNCPMVLGGLKSSDDEGKTYLRARIRRHRFKRGVLKSTDPIVMSIGWRRFQTIPVYDVEDQGGRRRYLKYTPEYLHCSATFWAPSVAPGAGVIMCQTLGRERTSFRIAATGVVTELDTECRVVKKLKLVGEPVKVHKNTAFIKGMFNSELEVSKYLGASIRTVSGVRGAIKKAIAANSQGNMLDRDLAKSPPGTFRAGFEDKILLSDIVFLRAWVPVEAQRFCSIATTLLDRQRDGSGTWRMRTIREVREAKQLPIPLSKDSLYQPIDRARPIFTPLRLSKKLEGSLPYASKPKNFARKSKPKALPTRKAAVSEERALILDDKERKERKFLQAIYSIRNDRVKRRKEAKGQALLRHKKQVEREETKHLGAQKERRKRKFAMEGAREARELKRARG